MVTIVKCKCAWCGKEIVRQLYGQKNFFCCPTHRALHYNQDHPPQGKATWKPTSPFTYYLSNVKNSLKTAPHYGPTDLTVEFLKDLYNSQHGKCPVSGVELIIPRSSSLKIYGQRHLRASIDRIDSNLTYVKTNVRFVNILINYIKGPFLDKDVLVFCKSVAQFQSGVDHGLGADHDTFEFKVDRGHSREQRPFLYFIASVNNKVKHRSRHSTDLDFDYLRTIFESQNGRCPITGFRLSLPSGNGGWKKQVHLMFKASLDRIDPSVSYLRGNVRFLSAMANIGRSDQPDSVLVDICKAVCDHNHLV